MFAERRTRKFLILITGIIVLVILLALATQLALANKSAQPPAQAPVQEAPSGTYDDATPDVGVDWINIFPNYNLDFNDDSCLGLSSALRNNGFPGAHNFNWGNDDAWEVDGKGAALGGYEQNWYDNVDIMMVCTQAATLNNDVSAAFYTFGHTDQYLTPTDALWAYGDKDLEWLAFDASRILSNPSAPYWANTFHGLHLLLGFTNNRYTYYPGDGMYWGYYMTGVMTDGSYTYPPHSIVQSWFTAVDYGQPSGTCARVLGEEQESFHDYLWGRGYVGPDIAPDWDYWYWDHCSSGPQLPKIESEQPEIIAVPVYNVQLRTVNEDYVLENIAPAFGFTGPVSQGSLFFFMQDTTGGITRTLQVDKVTGSFLYHDLSHLWVPPEVPPTLPDEAQAFSFLASFYKNQGIKLPGVLNINAPYYYYEEALVEVQRINPEQGILQGQQLASIPTDVVMTFPRVIPSNALTANGLQQLDMLVFGPGARMKAYLGGMDEIIGMQGGTRDVVNSGIMVNILTPEVVWGKFKQDPSLAIPEVSFLGDDLIYTAATLGYYEQPYIIPQTKLIPVWDFSVNAYSNGILVAENVDVYVPAAEEFMPPQVTILSPADGLSFRAGELISFQGSATGGTPPYTYVWTSSTDGTLGTSQNVIGSLGSAIKAGEVFNVTVSLQAMDANGMISTDTITLAINPVIWIPWIYK